MKCKCVLLDELSDSWGKNLYPENNIGLLMRSVATAIYVRCLKKLATGPYSKIHFNLILPSKTRFYM